VDQRPALLAAVPEHRRMAKIPRNVVFFSLDPSNAVLRHHVSRGALCGVVRELIGAADESVDRLSRGCIARVEPREFPISGV
jgi:hypothetical protein